MARFRLLIDTNVIVDYLNVRDPFFEKARLLMIAGRIGEFDLWVTTSQVTDLVYILSDGGSKRRIPSVLERLRGLLSFVNVYATSSLDVERMLATTWDDPEDALLFEAALSLKADCVVTRDRDGFESALVPARDCEELFDWFRMEFGIDYGEIAL